MRQSQERPGRRWWPKHKAGVPSLALAAATVLSAARPSGKPCGHVVSYFTYPTQGHSRGYEWRIFDPSRKVDNLFLSPPSPINGFDGVRWDTTFDNVWFGSGDSLYRVRWRQGARPQFITRLPQGCRRWWFNPDSACWQASRITDQPESDDSYDRFAGELWQSTRDGARWRVVRADSMDLIDADEDRWQWADGTQLGSEQPVVTLDDLASAAWDGAWEGKTAFIDTSTFTVTKDEGDGYDSNQWFFLGLKDAPRRGVAFRHGEPGAPEHAWHGVNGPLYLVDLDRRSKRLIDGTDQFGMRSLVAEHCGFLLVPSLMGNALVIDSSGRKLFSEPLSTDAVWVRRPKP